MRYVKARLSYARWVKLTLVCVIAAAAMLLLNCFAVYAEQPAAEPYEPRGRINLIRTSDSEDNYSVFEAEGDRITVRGRYDPDRVRKLFIDKNRSDFQGTYNISVHGDGSYEAELTMKPADPGEHKLYILLNSGAHMWYYVFYDNESGWYFPKNGYEKTNRDVFGHIYEAPAQAAALYLSASEDPAEISTALEQIDLIAHQVADSEETDIGKARAISEYIAKHLYYDKDARDNNVELSTVALYNVLKTGRTVCAGFANIFCAMAEAVGIDAVNIQGGAVTGKMSYAELDDASHPHEWAAFFDSASERWIWVDPCWDGSGNYEKGEFKEGKYRLMFFNISDDALSMTHRAHKAERRRYFEAKAETVILGAETDEEGEHLSVVTSQQTEAPEDLPGEDTLTAPAPDGGISREQPTEDPVSGQSDTVYIVIIAVLCVIIAAVIAVLIRIIVKGRKQEMVVIEFENGKQIKLELYPDIAPETVANFEELVNKGFYNGLTFHRVISGFMIQGGCPHGNGTGNSGKHIKGEFAANGFKNDLKHTRGVISMARAADPNSASCQFFIMHRDAPHLDGSYAAFGKVIEGMDVVDEIAECETDYSDKPVTPVVMKSVRIEA